MSSEPEDNTADPIEWSDIDPDTQHELVALAETLGSNDSREDAETTLSRRDVIAALGTAGVGAAIGGGAMYGATEPAAASHGGGTIGTASDPLDMVHTEDVSDLDSLTTDEHNRVHYLDPDASDTGAAIENKVAEMVDGDTLIVPPVVYDVQTTANIDKHINIIGHSVDTKVPPDATQDEPLPLLVKKADVPVLEAGENIRLRVEGIHMNADSNRSGVPADTTDGMIFHGTSTVIGCTSSQIGGVHFHFHQENASDNLNYSHVWNVAGHGGTDVVKIQQTASGGMDVNAITVRVLDARGGSGYAINGDRGFGNHYYVQHVADMGSGGVRINHNSNYAEVPYAEGNVVPVIHFTTESSNSMGAVGLYGGAAADEFQFDDQHNIGMRRGRHGQPLFVYGGASNKFGIAGTDVETTEPGKGILVTRPDGSARDRIRVDNNGSITVDNNQ